MLILQQSALFSSTLLPAVPPFPLLAAPPQRLALPAPQPRLMLSAPKIAGYLPIPQKVASSSVSITPVKREKRVVEAEIANPLLLIDIRRDPDAWWEEFERMYPSQTIEELDAEIEAKHPGWIKMKESWS